MNSPLTRRRFLKRTSTLLALGSLAQRGSLRARAEASQAWKTPSGADFHVHLDNSTLEKVLELSERRGLKFGIVEHAGTRENQYPKVLSTDAELKNYLEMLEGKPVFKGIQAEWTDWASCFSTSMLGRLDYVLTDAMTFPGPDGKRVKLWTPEAAQAIDFSNPQKFMDRFVDWHVEIMAKEPFDILANTSWLPAGMSEHWEAYWTEPRMKKVIEAALKYGIALEISASYRLPKLPFLKLAKAAGAKLSFGSNGRYPNMGKLDYCFEMAKQLELRPADMFVPAPDGQKAVQRRKV